jgi:Flp pilus assembly protein TadB
VTVTAIVVAVAAALIIVVVVRLWRGSVERRQLKEHRRFEAAAAMTSRWARDTSSAPRPVLDMAAQRRDEATDGGPADSD